MKNKKPISIKYKYTYFSMTLSFLNKFSLEVIKYFKCFGIFFSLIYWDAVIRNWFFFFKFWIWVFFLLIFLLSHRTRAVKVGKFYSKANAATIGSPYTENNLSLIFRKINDFVHRFILNHKTVDFTILVVNFTIHIINFTVSLLILPFYCWNQLYKMVKLTVKP
jgi:hypothetical protein